MTTSHITFENDLCEQLLNILYGQWHQLGVPFAPAAPPPANEVIDPEALLWCSLEFLPTEGRLREGVRSWLESHGDQIIRHRVKRVAKAKEPRTFIWRALTGRLDPDAGKPSEPCYGLASPAEVVDFCASLSDLGQHVGGRHRAGKPLPQPSTGLLIARDLLGGDIRHLILVYLLIRSSGAKLKDISHFSGYSYRSVAETAARLENAQALVVEHGYCRLVDPEPWHLLLHGLLRNAVLVDWFSVFEAIINVLRATAKAQRKGLAPDNSIITSFYRKAFDALDFAAFREEARVGSQSITHLCHVLSKGS